MLVLASAMFLTVACGTSGNTSSKESEDVSSQVTTSEDATSEVVTTSSEEAPVTSSSEDKPVTSSSEQKTSSSEETPVVEKHAITTTNLTSNGWTLTVDNEAKAGDTVTVKASYQYTLGTEVMFLYVNGQLTKSVETDGNDMFFQFTMPNEDVELVFCGEAGGQYNVSTARKVNFIGSEHIGAYGVDPEKPYNYFSVTLLKKVGYAIDKVVLVKNGAETELGEEDMYIYWEGLMGQFSYRGSETGDLTFKLYEKAVSVAKISYVGAENITSTLAAEATEGDEITIDCSTLTLAAGYTFGTGAVGAVATASGTAIEPSYNSNGRLIFKMPGEDIVVTFTNIIKSQTFNITKDAGVKSVRIEDYSGNDKSSCGAYSSVYVKIECEDGYMVSSVKLNGSNMSWQVYYGAYYGTTNGEDGAVQELVITTSKGYSVTTQSAEGGRLSLDASTYAAGAKVSGSVSTTSNFYTLSAIKAYKTDGTEVAKDDISLQWTVGSYSTSFSFVMPEYDIKLVPEFNKTSGVKFAGVTAGEAVTSWRIMGTKSYNAIDSDMTAEQISAAEFVDGEGLQVTVEHQAGYTVEVTVGGKTVAPEYDSGTYCTIYEGLSASANATVEIKTIAKKAANITLEAPEGATVSYSVNRETVTEVFTGDAFKISVTGDAGEGKAYIAKAYDAEGKELSKDYSGNYICSGDFKVVVTAVSGGTLSVNTASANAYITIQDDEEWTALKDGDTLSGGQQVSVMVYAYAKQHVTIVSNGVTVCDKDVEQYAQFNEIYTVEGDLSITVTSVAE